ncbi:MAG TPA: agmatine deiminase family protein [Streptosporangiaceae bacterium]
MITQNPEDRQPHPQGVPRRTVLGGGLAAAGGAAAAVLVPAPADHVRHARTWMAWPARRDVWGAQLAGVRGDVAAVARAIARYEPVAMVARPGQASGAARACGKGVDIVPLVNDDLWMRDMGPVFLVNGRGGLAGLDMNFNGWGNKQVHPNDAKIAREYWPCSECGALSRRSCLKAALSRSTATAP